MPPPQIGVQLQVAPCGRVHAQAVVAMLNAKGAYMGQGGALGLLDVLQQAAGGLYRHRQIGAAKAL